MLRFCFAVFASLIFALSLNGQSYQINILDETAHFTTVEFVLGAYAWKEVENNEFVLQAKGAGYLLKKGAPDVLKFSASIIIPDISETNIEFLQVDTSLMNQVSIAASKGNFTRQIDPASINRLKGEEYQQDAFFPHEKASLNKPYIFRDYRGQSISFFPFQYNPVSKQLIVNKRIVVKISKNQNEPGLNPLLRTGSRQDFSSAFSNIYRHHFANFQSTLYTPIAERGKMLIIAHEAFIPLLNEFVDWKKRSGMSVEVLGVNAAGGMHPENIKNFIFQKYSTEPLTFVLLVGDHPQIPSFTSGGGASDPSYGFLEGDDAYPEVIVGRISAETPAHVSTQLKRFIDYEKAENIDFDYLSTCMQIASEEGPGDNDEMDHEHAQLIREKLMNFTYDHAFEFYEGSQGGFDAQGNPTSGMGLDGINQGAGIINYTGHGSSSSWGTSGFNSNDISTLSNEGKLPFIWSVACVNGDFANYTCFAEHWLRAERNGKAIGAVGVFMSSINQYWSPPMAAQDEMIDLLVGTHGELVKRTFGGLSVNGCMKMNDLYDELGADMTATWHIFGDPSLMVRTTSPKTLTAQHPDSLQIGDDNVDILVNEEGAFVCLYQHDQILATASVIDGVASFSFEPINSLAVIDVTVTAFNHIPYQGSMSIAIPDDAFLTVTNLIINDSNGNNNQKADFGESLFLDLLIKNQGSTMAIDANITLSINHASANLITSSCNLGDISAGGSFLLSECLFIKINDWIQDQENLELLFSITDIYGHQWQSIKNIRLHAPLLQITGFDIDDADGNNNGRIDAGETVLLKVNTANCGSSTAIAGIMNLTITLQGVEVQENTKSFASMESGSTNDLEFSIAVTANVMPGTLLPLVLYMQSGLYQTERTFLLKINAMIDDAESGDLTYWPWISDSPKAWFADEEEKYEGFYSFRSGLINDSEKSSLSVSILTEEDDSVSFYRKISSEPDWDFLKFYINDTLVEQWSGLDHWKRFAYPILAGLNELRWVYEKDEVVSANEDAAWIDLIEIPTSSVFNSTGIDQIKVANQWNIFPNPTYGLVHLSNADFDGEQVVLEVFSVFGQMMMTKQLNHAIEVIDMASFSSGIYFFRISKTQDVIKTIRVVKLK